MQGSKEKENVLKYKLAYSGIVLLVYIIGKNIPLYGIDLSSYKQVTFRAEELLTQTISGDIYRSSVFAVGIFPDCWFSFFWQFGICLPKPGVLREKPEVSPFW